MNQENIRNFCIIAHIDHGKSTLADRFLEVTGTIEKRDMKKQVLDTMELEQERGITIKLQPARMEYKGNTLNLIDTPGHVDFSYEVSRSLSAVDGAILVVDASQGIEAQTLTTLTMAVDQGLTIIPVVNKIDLPHAEPEKVAKEIIDLLGISEDEIIFASGKTGEGVEKILDSVVAKVPSPKGNPTGKTKALIFDSFFDSYRGVICYVRVFDGKITKGEKLKMMSTNTEGEALEVGYLTPDFHPKNDLTCGAIGYIVTGLKDVSEARVGDTITLNSDPAEEPLPGYKKVTPFVFTGLFTTSGEDFQVLRDALGKLQLSDSALVYEPENSASLGFGFRCGFLGLLHMEIVKERLEREFDLNLIITTPSVSYEIEKMGGEVLFIKSPTDMPDRSEIKEIREPWLKLEVVTPKEFLGKVMDLTQKKRGVMKNISYLEENTALATFEAPLSSIVTDYYDDLKSVSSGYASLAYEMIGFRASDLIKLDILIAGEPADTLSMIIHREEAHTQGQKIVTKLKELVPKQNFKITLQAAIGGKIVAREDISPFRKDVTAKLYGGDVTRKRKLLEKQKKGKQKMKQIGQVSIPSDVFVKLLKK
jgi:GTP-binding protein LepA